MPLGAPVGRVTTTMPEFEVHHRYHTQGLAAGGSALLDAINKGKVHLARFILDAADHNVVNTRDFKGKTPLIRAIYIKEEKTRAKAIDLLLEKGADVNVQDEEGRTALSYACELRANDVVRILVMNNVDPDIADNQGNTPLIYSAMEGNDTAVEILIKCFRRLGLRVDHVNNEGLTPLLIAAKMGNIECASTLAIDGRASLTFRDPERNLNAEDWAREQGCTTPEVIAFSAHMADLRNKYMRRGSLPKCSASCLDPDMIPGVADRTTLEMQGSPPLQRHNDRDLSVDELTRRLNAHLHYRSSTSPANANGRNEFSESRARMKRNSLPTFQIFSVYHQSYGLDADGHSRRRDELEDSLPISLPKIDATTGSGITPRAILHADTLATTEEELLSQDTDTTGAGDQASSILINRGTKNRLSLNPPICKARKSPLTRRRQSAPCTEEVYHRVSMLQDSDSGIDTNASTSPRQYEEHDMLACPRTSLGGMEGGAAVGVTADPPSTSGSVKSTNSTIASSSKVEFDVTSPDLSRLAPPDAGADKDVVLGDPKKSHSAVELHSLATGSTPKNSKTLNKWRKTVNRVTRIMRNKSAIK